MDTKAVTVRNGRVIVRAGGDMFKRVFSRKGDSVTLTLRVPKMLRDAIDELASVYGESANHVAVVLLDEQLQNRARQGIIKFPELEDEAAPEPPTKKVTRRKS